MDEHLKNRLKWAKRFIERAASELWWFFRAYDQDPGVAATKQEEKSVVEIYQYLVSAHKILRKLIK